MRDNHSKLENVSFLAFMLHDTGSDPSMQKVCRELTFWNMLDHENIVPLLGTTICYETSSIFGPSTSTGMVSPWMENGNLITFMETRTLSIIDRLQIVRTFGDNKFV